jgi:hypothetical protein
MGRDLLKRPISLGVFFEKWKNRAVSWCSPLDPTNRAAEPLDITEILSRICYKPKLQVYLFRVVVHTKPQGYDSCYLSSVFRLLKMAQLDSRMLRTRVHDFNQKSSIPIACFA